MNNTVKLVIEISEGHYNEIMNKAKYICPTGLERVIANGISLEKVKAEWIEESDNYGHSSYFCSRCGTQEGKPSDICPNCRARMNNSEKARNNHGQRMGNRSDHRD